MQVMGPPLAANSSSESVKSWVKLMDGSTWPLVPPMGGSGAQALPSG